MLHPPAKVLRKIVKLLVIIPSFAIGQNFETRVKQSHHGLWLMAKCSGCYWRWTSGINDARLTINFGSQLINFALLFSKLKTPILYHPLLLKSFELNQGCICWIYPTDHSYTRFCRLDIIPKKGNSRSASVKWINGWKWPAQWFSVSTVVYHYGVYGKAIC